MARRYSGYVVGRRTVCGQPGWAIARRRTGERIVSFAPEATLAPGVELSTGLDVTFSTETRDGRIYALNVQPKTANKMEDSMRKLKMGLVVAGILAIIAIIGAYKPLHQEPMRTWTIEMRAENALETIRGLAAKEIITDEVIKAVVQPNPWGGLGGASRAARLAVFEEHQCHIFKPHFSDVEGVCHIARYSEGSGDGGIWYEKAGIPGTIAPVIANMRTELYQIGRSYLADPINLKTIYEARKGVMIAEFDSLGDNEKASFLEELSKTIAAFEQFQDDMLARDKYQVYIDLEAAWRADKSDSLDFYNAWQKAGDDLQFFVAGNLDHYLFAGRRHAEGGSELLAAYLEVMHDLEATLRG